MRLWLMIRPLSCILLTLPLLMAAAPDPKAALVTPPTLLPFTVGKTDLRFVVPPGYCAPDGEAAVGLAMVNAADPMNITPITVVSCRPGVAPMADYYMVKATKSLLDVEFSRKVLLAGLGPAFKTFDFKPVMDQVRTAMNDNFGSSIKLGEGTIVPLGQDDVCGYLGGVVSIQAGAEQKKIAAVVCITSVKMKMLNFYRFQADSPKLNQADMLASARALAERTIAENEK